MFTLEIGNSVFYNCDSLVPEIIDGKITGYQILTFDKVKKTKIIGDYIINHQ